MDEEELSALKYRQLQKIAKGKGLKANLPKDALIKGILKCQEENGELNTNTTETAKLESTTSSQSSCSENESEFNGEDAEPKKLNETFEVKESSILTNDEDLSSNLLEKKTVSAFNTPTLMNASDRFEQFFGIDDEHIPVMVSPKQYSAKHVSPSKTPKISSIVASDASKKKSFSNTPTERSIQKNRSQKDVFARLSSVVPKRSSMTCTPKSNTKEATKPYSALKGNFSSRKSTNMGISGSVQKRAGIMQSSKKSAIGNKLANTANKKVRLVEMAKDTNITQRSNIPKIVKRKVPDFAKLHAREFNKTDTLDNYLTKKKERANALTPGPKSAKKVPMNGDVKKNMPVMASLDGSLKNVPVRRSPRNVETGGNKNFENRERKGFVPTNITVNAANFKFSQGSANRNINQRQAVNSLQKPFVFSAKENITSVKPEKILSNITNSPSVNKVSHQQANLNRKQTSSKPFAYKPYTGKVGQWNPKKTLEERKALANKTAPRTKKGELIKGVRLNKRAELLMNKRGIHAKD